MRANVKPLVHWAIYKGYTLRFGRRTPQQVDGVLTRPDGAVNFSYDPQARTLRMPETAADAGTPPAELVIRINEHGWEIE